MRKLIKIIFHVYIEHTILEYKQIKLELNFHDWRIDGTMCWLSTRTKVRAYLFETFLADGLRIDLHLEDDGIGLADKTPHLCFDHSFLRWPLNSRINPSPAIPSRKGTEDPTKHFYTRRARYLHTTTATMTTIFRPDTRLVGDRSCPVIPSLS